MNICHQNGWCETNEPVCASCANPIRVRGDEPMNAVLMGEVLACIDGEKVLWLAHFNCRTADWRAAKKTDKWHVRTMPGRVYVLLTSRPDWAKKEPWIVGK